MLDSSSEPAAADISAAILTAPGWARVGITMPDQALRERAAHALAQAILERTWKEHGEPDPAQLGLGF